MSDPESKIFPIPSGETDKVKADRYREEVYKKLLELCAIFDTAKKDGIAFSFGVAPNGFGKHYVTEVKAVKEL